MNFSSKAHKKLYTFLKHRSLTQKQVASDSGLSPSLISEILTQKKTSVSLEVAYKLEKAFGIKLQDWFTK